MARPGIKVGAPDLRLAPERAVEPLAWPEAFGRAGPVEVEVGIGKGRFLLAAAAARPEVLHLGVEWANKYLRVAEERAARRALSNVRFIRADARDLVHRAIATASVSAYYVFYPDPWPKKRHHKRRFFRPDTVDHLARTLEEGGLLHSSTDHAEYWEAIAALLDGHPAFERLPAFGGAGFPGPLRSTSWRGGRGTGRAGAAGRRRAGALRSARAAPPSA
jgi:tRNA (guanine-N7-)-methyltransferase